MSEESVLDISVIGRVLFEQFKVKTKSQYEFSLFFTDDPQLIGMEIIGYRLFDLMHNVNLANDLAKGLGLYTWNMEIALHPDDIKVGICIENARLQASIYFSTKSPDTTD